MLADVEPLLDPYAVYASNTSTIPIGRIAERAARPGRVVGMHFFSPVHKMPLLEVVATPRTDRDATVTAVAYGKALHDTASSTPPAGDPVVLAFTPPAKRDKHPTGRITGMGTIH